jgi:hypothetical protein
LRAQPDTLVDTVNSWLESMPSPEAEHIEARADLRRLVAASS